MKRIILLSLFTLIMVGVFYRILLHAHGLTVTSWWRWPWKNSEVGGKKFSLHQIGWAFDVVPMNSALQRVMKYFPFGKFVPESDHLHIQIL